MKKRHEDFIYGRDVYDVDFVWEGGGETGGATTVDSGDVDGGVGCVLSLL